MAATTMIGTAMVASLAVVVDALLGEPRRAHPLVGFGHLARAVEKALNADRDLTPKSVIPAKAGVHDGADTAAGRALDSRLRGNHGSQSENARGRLTGMTALLFVVAPPTLLLVTALHFASAFPLLVIAGDVAVLYLAIGHRSLREHANAVFDALQSNDIEHARTRVGYMVSRQTGAMGEPKIAAATVESVLENGSDAVFGALFWFALAGAPGALAYRLVNTLDAMWGYRTPRYQHFGWSAARLDDVMNWMPARLVALSYAMLGRTRDALRCWSMQAPRWDSPNGGPVMAAGAGSLGLLLGGAATYHGVMKERPLLGMGVPASAADIPRSLRLVLNTLLLWLAAMWAGALTMTVMSRA